MSSKPTTEAIAAHGMDGGLVTPDWPPLSLAELRPLFARFSAIGGPLEILTVSPRPFSSAGVIATRSGNVFVKRHSGSVRSCEGLLEEHRFLAHLAAHGAPVPRVLASDSGGTAIAIGDATYEIHEIPEGVDLYGDAISWTPFRSAAHSFSAGQILARLHLAAQSFTGPARKPRPLVASFTIFSAKDPAAAMEQYLGARPALAHHAAIRSCAAQALDLLAPFRAELTPLLPALPSLWTHNDLHASNLFWSGSGAGSEQTAQATAAIDFGLSDRTSTVHDIAHAIERNMVEWLTLVHDPSHPELVEVHLDHLFAFLDGYESLRPLTLAESSALAPMTAVCHAEFALSEADYFLSVLHSEEKAVMAYDGWLVGHARWFRGPGELLLDALRLRHAARTTSQQGSARA